MPPGLYGKLLMRVLTPLALGYGLALIDRMNVSMGQLQMAHDLHLSQGTFGIASSAFFTTYLALQIPCNFFLPRVGARRALAFYLAAWGCTAALQSVVTSAVGSLLSSYASAEQF